MTTGELLDSILVPRPNGSAGLEQVASFLQQALGALELVPGDDYAPSLFSKVAIELESKRATR